MFYSFQDRTIIKLVSTERMMCGVTLRGRISSSEFSERVGVESIEEWLRSTDLNIKTGSSIGRSEMKWFGSHIERPNSIQLGYTRECLFL